MYGCIAGRSLLHTLPAKTLDVRINPHSNQWATQSDWLGRIDAMLFSREPVYSAAPLPSSGHITRLYSGKRCVGFGSRDVAHLTSLLPRVDTAASDAFVPATSSAVASQMSPHVLSSAVVPLSTPHGDDSYSRFLAGLTAAHWRPTAITTSAVVVSGSGSSSSSVVMTPSAVV